MAPPVSDSFEPCCEDLRYAVEDASEPSFFVNEGGVLFLTIGRIRTDEGEGLFDQAVLYCPFCGAVLQTREGIKRAAEANQP
jgi:hypothetical protein